jgi:hypothetical protein
MAWIELKNLAPIHWSLVSVLGNNFVYNNSQQNTLQHIVMVNVLYSCCRSHCSSACRWNLQNYLSLCFNKSQNDRQAFQYVKKFSRCFWQKKLSQKCLCSTLGFSRVGSLWIWGPRFLFCQGKLVQVASHHNQVKSSIPMMIKQSKSREL